MPARGRSSYPRILTLPEKEDDISGVASPHPGGRRRAESAFPPASWQDKPGTTPAPGVRDLRLILASPTRSLRLLRGSSRQAGSPPGIPPSLARGEGRAQPDSGKQSPGCPKAGRPQPSQHSRGAGKRDRLSPGALPLYTGELGLRLSGELLLLLLPLSGDRRCLPFTLPGSAPPPPAASGGVALGGGGGLPPPRPPPPLPGPVLLPTEADGDRVGLCWLPRRSWYGTVARIGWSSRLVPAEPPPPPLPRPPAVPAVGDPAAPRLILCGGGWWWDGGVCEELDEDIARTRKTPAGHSLRWLRRTRARPPEPRMHRPRGKEEEGGGMEGGGGAGQALHGPRESPRRLPSCPRRFLSATAAAASTPGSSHRCPPQRREHRGRCRAQRPLTSYSAAGSGRSAAGDDEGTRSRSGKDGEGGRRSQPALAPAPVPAREPLPAPSAPRAARPPNGTAQPRHPAATGRGGGRASPLGATAAPARAPLAGGPVARRSQPMGAGGAAGAWPAAERRAGGSGMWRRRAGRARQRWDEVSGEERGENGPGVPWVRCRDALVSSK